MGGYALYVFAVFVALPVRVRGWSGFDLDDTIIASSSHLARPFVHTASLCLAPFSRLFYRHHFCCCLISKQPIGWLLEQDKINITT